MRYLNRIMIIVILFSLLFIILEMSVIAKEGKSSNDKSNNDAPSENKGNNKQSNEKPENKGATEQNNEPPEKKGNNKQNNEKPENKGNNKQNNEKPENKGNGKTKDGDNKNAKNDNKVHVINNNGKKNNGKGNKNSQVEDETIDLTYIVVTEDGTYSSSGVLGKEIFTISSQNMGLIILSLVIVLIVFLGKGRFIYLTDKK